MTYEEYVKENEEFLNRAKNDNYIIERSWWMNKLSNIICFVDMQPMSNMKKAVLDDLKLLNRIIKNKERF